VEIQPRRHPRQRFAPWNRDRRSAPAAAGAL